MQCPNCGASHPGWRCPFCGQGDGAQGAVAQPGAAGGAYPGASSQPTANDPAYRAAVGQPTANDPAYRAAVGQPTANDPSWPAAMGQPQGPYNAGPAPFAPMIGQGAAPMAKKGCCGCLSVMMLAGLAAFAISLALVLF